MNFYKSVIEYKGKLLVRGIHEGQEYKEKIDFDPTLYSLTQQQTEFKSLQGQFLKPITFKTIDDARKFRREVATENSPIYGLERYHYQYINKKFPEDIYGDDALFYFLTLSDTANSEPFLLFIKQYPSSLHLSDVRVMLNNAKK